MPPPAPTAPASSPAPLGPGAGASSFLDPAALLRIHSLELRARLIMEGLNRGLHRSPHHGFSSEFSEYRAYVRGDDPRFIDWKAAARSDRWYVKKFEEETSLRCHLLFDASASMQFTSGAHRKVTYAATLAATLGLFLMDQGDAVGVTLFDDTIRDHLPARRRSGQLHNLLTLLQRAEIPPPASGPPKMARSTTVEPAPPQPFALRQTALFPLLRRRALLIILSDFLTPLDGLEAQFSLLAAMGHEILLLQTLDPAERDFPFEQSGVYVDPESGRQLLINPSTARQNYLAKFQAHQSALSALCGRAGVTHRVAYTDAPIEGFLFEFLKTRPSGRAQQRRLPTSSR